MKKSTIGFSAYVIVSCLAFLSCVRATLQYAQLLDESMVNWNSHSKISTLPEVSPSSPPFSSLSFFYIPFNTPIFSLISSSTSLLSIVSNSWLHLSFLSTSAYFTPIRLFTLFTMGKINLLCTFNVVLSFMCMTIHLTQLFVLGTLNQQERKIARETTFNFILQRFVFLLALLPVDMRELLLWSNFFLLIGVMHFLLALTRERFTTLNLQSTMISSTFIRMILFVAVISGVNVFMGMACWKLLYERAGMSVTALALFEHAVIAVTAMKVAAKYLVQLWTMRNNVAWEERNSYIYHIELISEVCIALLTQSHLLHVWSFYGLSITLIDLFLFLHLRAIFLDFTNRLLSFASYRSATRDIDTRYPDATEHELQRLDDNCAICREIMDSAKKLPCGHYFHRSCLHQWMEYRRICPSCRCPLGRNNQSQNRRQESVSPNAAAVFSTDPSSTEMSSSSMSSTSSAPTITSFHIPRADSASAASQSSDIVPSLPVSPTSSTTSPIPTPFVFASTTSVPNRDGTAVLVERRALILEATARRLQSTPRSALFPIFDAPEE